MRYRLLGVFLTIHATIYFIYLSYGVQFRLPGGYVRHFDAPSMLFTIHIFVQLFIGIAFIIISTKQCVIINFYHGASIIIVGMIVSYFSYSWHYLYIWLGVAVIDYANDRRGYLWPKGAIYGLCMHVGIVTVNVVYLIFRREYKIATISDMPYDSRLIEQIIYPINIYLTKGVLYAIDPTNYNVLIDANIVRIFDYTRSLLNVLIYAFIGMVIGIALRMKNNSSSKASD